MIKVTLFIDYKHFLRQKWKSIIHLDSLDLLPEQKLDKSFQHLSMQNRLLSYFWKFNWLLHSQFMQRTKDNAKVRFK